MSVDFLIFIAVKDCDFTSSCGYKNRRSFLNVYIIERLVLSHIFYFNRYNSCLSPCIFVVFITCVIYNPHDRHPAPQGISLFLLPLLSLLPLLQVSAPSFLSRYCARSFSCCPPPPYEERSTFLSAITLSSGRRQEGELMPLLPDISPFPYFHFPYFRTKIQSCPSIFLTVSCMHNNALPTLIPASWSCQICLETVICFLSGLLLCILPALIAIILWKTVSSYASSLFQL